MNIENFKRKFPNYKITDASDRTPEQIIRICKICDKVNNVLVFIERNKKNESYFEFIETMESITAGSFRYIILTDQSFYVHQRDDYTSYIMHLQRMLRNEIQCPVCFDEKINEYVFCNQCACACCTVCYKKMYVKLCPTCRNDTFSAMNID